MEWSWEMTVARVAAIGTLMAGVATIIQTAHDATALKRFERWVAVEAAYGAESHMGAIARRRRDEAVSEHLAWMQRRVIIISLIVCCVGLTAGVGWFLVLSLIVHPETTKDATWMTVLICATIFVAGLIVASVAVQRAALRASQKRILPAIRSAEDLALGEKLAALDVTTS